MRRSLKIRIFGEVQGVSFRYYAVLAARGLSLSGFVRNDPDGSVYIEAEGKSEDLEEFVNWCKKGPGFARVSRVEVRPGPRKNFSDFSVGR
ncbi:MAG: acylphosphatase [Candidatus Doudnabacteria bacterium]|nr:acylphosphatase [Candidatus Doudnabacteria bacterium]